MSVVRTVALFLVAALAEIGGAWLIWQGVREQRGVAWVGAGIVALSTYGFVATLQEDANFGRILAAYGGIFVAGSLAWGGSSSTGSGLIASTTSVRRSVWSVWP
jgi:small multidrug resistance family-3 protein